MLPILQIGPLAVPAPALIVLLGFWIGLELMEKQASYFNVEPGPLYSLILVSVIAGLLGARFVYALRAPAAFLVNPLNLLALLPQMFDPTGGVLAALLAGLVYRWVKHMPLWPNLDALTSLFAVLGVALGLAHFASGDAFGAPTQVPWAINLWGEMRHPSQVYEVLAALLIAAAVWPHLRALPRLAQARPGLRWWIFLALSAGARLFLETFRGDSMLLLNVFRTAQVIAWLVLALSLWQIGRRLSPPASMAEETSGAEQGG